MDEPRTANRRLPLLLLPAIDFLPAASELPDHPPARGV
jgi:hypothetical protein